MKTAKNMADLGVSSSDKRTGSANTVNTSRISGSFIAIVFAIVLLWLLTGCGNETVSQTSTPKITESIADPEITEPTESAAPTVSPGTDEEPSPAKHDYALPLSGAGADFEIAVVLDPAVSGTFKRMSENSVWREISRRTGMGPKFLTYTPEQAQTQYGVSFAIGEYPDAMQDLQVFYPGGVDAAVRDGLAIDLAPYLEEYAPNINWYLTRDESAMKAALTDSGTIGQIPRLLSAPCGEIDGILLRQDWLTALKLDSPRTYSQYRDVLAAFNKYNGSQLWFGGALWAGGFGVPDAMGDWLETSAPLFVERDIVYWGPASPRYLEYLTVMHSWFEAGLINPNSLTAPSVPAPQNLVSSGKCSAFVTNYRFFDGYAKNLSATSGGVLAGSGSPVKEVGGVHRFMGDYGKLVLPGSGFSITSDCEEPEKLLQLFDYRYSDAGASLCNIGVADEAHTVTNGVPYFKSVILGSVGNGRPSALARYRYLSPPGLYAENPYQYDPMLSWSALALREVWSRNRDNSYALPDFVTLTDEEQARFGTMIFGLRDLVQYETLRFIKGERDLDDWDEFVAEQNRLGAEVITALVADAYARYTSRS